MFPEPSIRSVLVSANKAYFTGQYGERAIADVAAHMEPEEAQLILRDFIPSAWFPEHVHANFLELAVQVLGNGDLSVARNAGISAASTTVPRVYKVFVRVATPKYIIENSASFWRQSHTHGRLEVTSAGPKKATIKLVDFPCTNSAFCESLAGFFEGLLRICGCKEIIIQHTRCRAKGFSNCEFPSTWK